MNTRDLTVVLAGNPNCGKTVVFNALTGSRQRVGNWPGVTVEKKMGHFSHLSRSVTVVDLPGVYSTSVANVGAVDEAVACQYLFSGEADLIVNIVDASHLSRHLYLTLQLLEMNIPMIVAVNMMDLAQKQHLKIDLAQLSQLLGCPVVGLVARQHQGIDVLKKMIGEATLATSPAFDLPLPAEVTQAQQALASQLSLANDKQAKWLALRLLAQDRFATRHVNSQILANAEIAAAAITEKCQQAPDILIASSRYQQLNQVIQQVLQRPATSPPTFTQRLDRWVLHRYFGVPIFLVVMYLMFLFAINVGGAFQDFFDISSATLFVDGLTHVLLSWHVPPWAIAILAQGVGKGINTTLTFIPVIGALFLFLSFLEDSGYMARAAFVMDRLMQILGLPGKSFVPMIVGFGCNVPAVMGARTLENRRDRILTVMMMPFMSCGARLAIFAVFASAFFPHGGAFIIFILYLAGILIAVLTGWVLRKTVLPGKPAPLILELPAYHVPRFGSLSRHMWQRLKSFLTRAGRVIIPVCVILGVLNALGLNGQWVQDAKQPSLLSVTGRFITPIFAPMGIDQNNWPATVGLATGILAKEVVVGTLNSLYGQQDQVVTSSGTMWQGLEAAIISIPQNLKGLVDALKNPIAASEAPHEMNQTAYGTMSHAFAGKLGAFAYLLFVLLYFPCVSTMAVMRREIGASWACFSVLWSTGLAYVLAIICYQCGLLVTHPLSATLWLITAITSLMMAFLGMRWYAQRGTVLTASLDDAACSDKPMVCGVKCQLCQMNNKV